MSLNISVKLQTFYTWLKWFYLFQSYLSYTEGCYAGVRTLDAKNLWTDLDTQAKVTFEYKFDFLITAYVYWLG